VKWRDARPHFSDVSPSHLAYPAAARAVSAGVMETLDGESFHLARSVSGSEAVDTVTKRQALAKR